MSTNPIVSINIMVTIYLTTKINLKIFLEVHWPLVAGHDGPLSCWMFHPATVSKWHRAEYHDIIYAAQ